MHSLHVMSTMPNMLQQAETPEQTGVHSHLHARDTEMSCWCMIADTPEVADAVPASTVQAAAVAPRPSGAAAAAMPATTGPEDAAMPAAEYQQMLSDLRAYASESVPQPQAPGLPPLLPSLDALASAGIWAPKMPPMPCSSPGKSPAHECLQRCSDCLQLAGHM